MTRFVDSVTERYGALAGSPADGADAAIHQLWALAYREASTLVFADAFPAVPSWWRPCWCR
jgi:DHA2 family multidrug resistance protein